MADWLTFCRFWFVVITRFSDRYPDPFLGSQQRPRHSHAVFWRHPPRCRPVQTHKPGCKECTGRGRVPGYFRSGNQKISQTQMNVIGKEWRNVGYLRIEGMVVPGCCLYDCATFLFISLYLQRLWPRWLKVRMSHGAELAASTCKFEWHEGQQNARLRWNSERPCSVGDD